MIYRDKISETNFYQIFLGRKYLIYDSFNYWWIANGDKNPSIKRYALLLKTTSSEGNRTFFHFYYGRYPTGLTFSTIMRDIISFATFTISKYFNSTKIIEKNFCYFFSEQTIDSILHKNITSQVHGSNNLF